MGIVFVSYYCFIYLVKLLGDDEEGKAERLRVATVKEMIQTEEGYVNDLKILEEVRIIIFILLFIIYLPVGFPPSFAIYASSS